MEQPTVRIELPGQAWAVIYRDVLRKTARLQEAELRRHMTPVASEAGRKMLLSELQAGKTPPKEGDYVIDFDAIDNDAINDMYMLNQTAEWSFGPIASATLEMMPSAAYKALAEEMDRLYKPVPLPKTAA